MRPAGPSLDEALDPLLSELEVLDAAHALGDVKDKQYEQRKQGLLVEIGLAKVKARLAPGEEVLAQHHFQQSRFPFTGFAFQDAAQESLSFFATGRRIFRWRFVDHPDRRASLHGRDRLEAQDYSRLRAVLPRREWRWGEAAAAVATILLALVFWSWLEITGPVLLLVGAAGLGHALFWPTGYWLLAGTDQSRAWRVYAVRKRSARALIGVVKAGVEGPSLVTAAEAD